MVSTEQSLKDQIIQKAWEDAEFKKQLQANPKAAVKDAFGVDVPDSIKVDVLEESADQYYLVIPQNPADLAVKADDEAAAWQ